MFLASTMYQLGTFPGIVYKAVNEIYKSETLRVYILVVRDNE